MRIPADVDADVVSCVCGHLRDEHSGAFLADCLVCEDCLDYEADEADITSWARQAGRVYSSDRVTLADVVAATGMDVTSWPGACYAVAVALHRHLQVSGAAPEARAVYGHWRGFIAPSSMFANVAHVGFARHGWIDLGDGTVLDPTRWVFEDVQPYIFEGPSDAYDEGGNDVRARMLRPFPAATGPTARLLLSADAAAHLGNLTGLAVHPGGDRVGLDVDVHQCHWVATVPLAMLAEHAGAIYSALIAAGNGAFIPVDNRRAAMQLV